MLKQISKFFQANRILIPILILGAILRFSWISDIPPSLNWDEISHGYNAYSILKTGKDEWGKSFPIIFKAYGDYKLPVYIYLTSLSEFLFGLNTFAVRLPSTLAGITTVIFAFLLAKKLFNRKVAVMASLLVAIEPWSLFLSRGAFEANLSLAFILSGVYFFLIGLERNKFLPVSAVLLGLSVWTYNSARVFVPLLSVVLGFLYKKEIFDLWKKDKKRLVFCTLILAFFFIPMFWQLLNPSGQARHGWVAILDEGAITQINEARLVSDLPGTLTRFIHNKPVYFAKSFLTNYFSHFSLDFLFLKGGTHFQFSIPGHGLLYLINLPFFLLGLGILLVKFKKRSFQLIIAWFLLAPVASSLTREAPHVLRSIVFLPMPQIISAVGLVSSFIWIKKRLKGSGIFLIGAYLFILLFQIESYGQDVALVYREKYSWAWQYGYEEVVFYAKEHYNEYDKIIVTKKYGEPHEFFLFYWPWDPEKFQNDPNLIRFYQSNWYWVDRFDKFYFVNDWDIPDEGADFKLESGGEFSCVDKECLLVTSPENSPEGWSKLQTINFLDREPAFEVYEN